MVTIDCHVMIRLMCGASVSLQLAGTVEEGSINLPRYPEDGAFLSFVMNIKNSILRKLL